MLKYFRETLLGHLNVYVRQTRDAFTERSSLHAGDKRKGINIPEVVDDIYWVKTNERQVTDPSVFSQLMHKIKYFDGLKQLQIYCL